MPELLLELFSEEIPARMQGRAAEDLKRLICDGLTAASLDFDRAEACATPRRLALVVDGLPERQPDVTEEKRGPRVGAPEPAVRGFLKANGIAALDQCEQRETGRGVFWFYVLAHDGRPTAQVLPEIVREAVEALPWPKSMRWGNGGMRWVRPLQRIVCLFDGTVVPVPLSSSVPVGELTSGHRFHAPEPFAVRDFADYRDRLRAAKVMLDAGERRRVIAERAAALAASEGLAVRDDPGLLDEVAGLVEWPVVLMGRIDEAFMGVPPEVLITSMRTHQRYFALEGPDGALAPRFIVVANQETADGGAAVVAGNERVLRARLSDATFFWDQDRRRPLESRVPRLAEMVFHARLGTLADKVSRLQALAAELAPRIPGAELDAVRSAALLAKADLTTEMVGEFPELQGVMGRYYALEEGERPEVAAAIAEHYAPAGPADRCPGAPVSVAVALADKLDTLVGFFAIGEKPSGRGDPFALRRAALGVIRLIVENEIRLPLRPIIDLAKGPVVDTIAQVARSAAAAKGASRTIGFLTGISTKPGWGQIDQVTFDLLDFIMDRLKVALRDKGVRHDLVSAVFAVGGEDDLVRLLARVEALQRFLGTDDGANLLTAYKRARNIVAIEERKDKRSYDGEPDPGAIVAAEEAALHARLGEARAAAEESLGREDFAGAMRALAALRGPVDAFFDRVTVNVEETTLRENRLKLLSGIRATMNVVADFSCIEG